MHSIIYLVGLVVVVACPERPWTSLTALSRRIVP